MMTMLLILPEGREKKEGNESGKNKHSSLQGRLHLKSRRRKECQSALKASALAV